MTAQESTNTDGGQATTCGFTYADLLNYGAQHLRSQGMTKNPIANMCSALRQWMKLHAFNKNRLVHDDFGAHFDRLYMRFSDLLAERVKKRTQRDRLEQLLRWQTLAGLMQRIDVLPDDFKAALRTAVHVSGRTRRDIARDTGIAVPTLVRWLDGDGFPRGNSVSLMPQLEQSLRLPPDTLLRRLPASRYVRYARSKAPQEGAASDSRQCRKYGPRLPTHRNQVFAGRLVEEWHDVLALKTDAQREGGTPNNTWRLKPARQTAQRIQPWMVFGNMSCATAGVQWRMVSSYLGWLKLPRPAGAGLAPDCVDTIAHLADADRVIAYARWLIHRAEGKVHNGVTVTLQTFCSYLRPGTGFLWLNPALRHKVIELSERGCSWATSLTSDEAWQQHCASSQKQIRQYLRRQLRYGQKPQRNRNPTERAAVVLNDEAPLRVLVRFIERLKSSPPPAVHERDYRAWLRDVVLCLMMVHNPLRAETYAVMTYREDGTGNLIRTGPMSFKLKFPPEAFKNQKGAASQEYEVTVDSSIAPWINRYLAEARPFMPDAGASDRFFLPSAQGPRKAQAHLENAGIAEPLGYKACGLSSRLKNLTATYIDGCPGFGSHAFRHIIATDHLQRHPGDYVTVAVLLHDTLATVLKNYSHLKTEHGLRSLSRDIRQFADEIVRGSVAESY